MLSNEALNLLLGTSTPGGCFDLSLLEVNYAAVVSLVQTAQYTPCSNLIQELHTYVPRFGVQESKFWVRWEKVDVEKNKGNSKRRKGRAFFLKKETHGMFGILSQIEHPRRCKLRYFLSRGQNTDSDTHTGGRPAVAFYDPHLPIASRSVA